MRIRNAAIAGATALAVAFTGTSVAVAQEATPTTQAPVEAGSASFDGASSKKDTANEESKPEDKKGTLSSKLGNKLEGDKPAQGAGIFGSSKGDGEHEWSFDQQPAWAKVFFGTTIFAAVASVIGLVLGPVANYFQFGPASR